MSFAETGCLFKCMRELQDAEILLVAADDLQADGKTFGREAGRHRGCGISGGRDVPAGLHPVDVVVEVHAGDLGWIGRVDVERRQLRGGQDEVLILLEEGLEAAPDEAMGNLGTGDVLAGEFQACLDFVFERVLEGVGVLLQHRAVVGSVGPCAEGAEGDFGGREVGLSLLDDAAERFERSAMRVDDGADAWVEGHAAEVFEPGDAHAFEAAFERAREEVRRAR